MARTEENRLDSGVPRNYAELREQIHAIVERCSYLLPAQGPLEVFVHHNTLHALQHLPFHEALGEARRIWGAETYLSEVQYREARNAGRIRQGDLEEALQEFGPAPPEMPATLPPSFEWVMAMMLHGVQSPPPAVVRWRLDEELARSRFAPGVSREARSAIIRDTSEWLSGLLEGGEPEKLAAMIFPGISADDAVREFHTVIGAKPARRGFREMKNSQAEALAVAALWGACQKLSSSSHAPAPRLTPAAKLRIITGEDPAHLVNFLLIPLCGAFLDRGQTHWPMPGRDKGLIECWLHLISSADWTAPAWIDGLRERLIQWKAGGGQAGELIVSSLESLGVSPASAEQFILDSLLQLGGWAGMFNRLETAPGPIGRTPAKVRLLDFLAVRLLLDIHAWRDVARRSGFRGTDLELLGWIESMAARRQRMGRSGDLSWPLFILSQHLGVSAPKLLALDQDGFRTIESLFAVFGEAERLKIWHEAYERGYRDPVLEGVAAAVKTPAPEVRAKYQIITCIDDREESFRRYLEELSPECQTFGAAGFFGLAIAFRGLDDPATFPLCPVVLTPRHFIEELPVAGQDGLAELRRQQLSLWVRMNEAFRKGGSSLVWGPVVTAVGGMMAAIPLLANVFAPGLAGRLRKWVADQTPRPATVLTTPREEGCGAESDGLFHGFTVAEKIERVAALLENIGLVRDFAPLVAVLGHTSETVNNPHFAAYACGACGGRSGGPNARLFARMANRPEVREGLKKHGIHIPDDTWFIGGVHETCGDAIELFDVEAIPPRFASHLAGLRGHLNSVRRNNALERCRRFHSARHIHTPGEALRHVESRTFDLAQARPELGHATNAACIVGRRDLSRRLFLDRRSFLVSYDPSIDPEGQILERILAAVGPVGAGINLEYFFSAVDNERFGAGTKLPHNVTGLFGVMNGAASDLRTGLPRQMIEIHEPVRLQLIVEAAPETLLAICERQAELRELTVNEWIRVISIHPSTREFNIFMAGKGFIPWRGGGETIPQAASSSGWFMGRHGFLAPALIGVHRSERSDHA
ncbi:MAG: hypothetical protein GMKNLPBB_03078 [Myxococcota bacterium]|nr:hypothetical protein [Myxococcota bacterium]